MLQVIILARESDIQLELEDIPVKSLVPEPLRVSFTDLIMLNYCLDLTESLC